MTWKRKPKELTREEAIKLAKQELAPYWHGSPPLLAGVRLGAARPTAHPLDPSFAEKTWIMVFADPMGYLSDHALIYVEKWAKRYSAQSVSFLLLAKPGYPFLTEPKTTAGWLKKKRLQMPFVYDANELLAQSFGIEQYPTVVLVKQDAPIISATIESMERFEDELQKTLRLTDPGLAMRPIFSHPGTYIKETVKIEFGRNRGAHFPAPGFQAPVEGYGSGRFAAPKPAHLKSGDIHLSGLWVQDADRIGTSDPKAELVVMSPSPYFSVVAQAANKEIEPTKIFFQVNGMVPPDNCWGEDVRYDDENGTFFVVERGGVHHALKKLPMDKREITLRFPHAKLKPIAIYGFRFGE